MYYVLDSKAGLAFAVEKFPGVSSIDQLTDWTEIISCLVLQVLETMMTHWPTQP